MRIKGGRAEGRAIEQERSQKWSSGFLEYQVAFDAKARQAGQQMFL
jgi:hypothetical protein